MDKYNLLRIELLDRKDQLDSEISRLLPQDVRMIVLYIKRQEIIRILEVMKNKSTRTRKRHLKIVC